MSTPDFYVVRYKECAHNEWNAFVTECDEAWFWHHSDFQNAWPYGENVSFCIKNKNNEIVLMQSLVFSGTIRQKKYGWHRWHRIIPYYGKYKHTNRFTSVGSFARKTGLSKKEERKLREFYLSVMQSLVDEYQIGSFSYSIHATLPPAYWPSVCPLVNPMIFYGYRNKMSQAYIIDLCASEDEIFRDYSQTCRNLIHRCKKDPEIRIVEAQPTQEDLDKYYSLHVETYHRTGATPHPKKYFESIFFNVLKNGICHILFLYRGDTLVVAHNTLLFKDAAYYWTGASITQKGDGETRLLMHEQILYAKKMGCRYFEVGECFPNVLEGKHKGLNDFKKSFGGSIHPIFSGEFVIPPT